MHSIFFKTLISLCILLSLSTPALAESALAPEVADKIVAEFLKLKAPDSTSTYFEHWTYNTAFFTTSHCWNHLQPDKPFPISTKPLTKNMTWALPKNDKVTSRLCNSIAEKGILAVCTHSTLALKGVKRKSGFPLQYLQVHEDKPLKTEGALGCYLNSAQVHRQSYGGPLTITWTEKPRLKTIQLRHGPKKVKAGNIMITAPDVRGLSGIPYREPRVAIVISNH